MFKPLQIIIFLLFITLGIYSQTSIGGRIINKKTREVIPFANIVMQKSGLVAHSDERGQFSIPNIHPADTLIVSSIGFATQKISSVIFMNQMCVELTETTYGLSEICVLDKDKSKRDMHEVGGYYYKKHRNMSTGCYVGFQFSELMPNQISKIGRVEKIRLCFMKTSNNYPYVDIRIRVMSVNAETGLPEKDVLEKPIVISPQTGNYEVNLRSLNLIFPLNGLFVTLEWVDSRHVTQGEHADVAPCLQWSGSKDHECRTYARRPGGKWVLESFKELDRAEKMNAMIGLEFSTIRKKD